MNLRKIDKTLITKSIRQEINGSGNRHIIDRMNSIITEYVDSITKLSNDTNVEVNIKSNSFLVEDQFKEIKLALQAYFEGNATDAHKTINNIINRQDIKQLLYNLKYDMKAFVWQRDLKSQYDNKHKLLFRIRTSNNELINKNDIFHVPLADRHLVDTYRYSIKGIPCLYLGESLIVCWEEKERPPFASTYASKYVLKKNIYVLDFNNPTGKSISEYDDSGIINLNKNITDDKISSYYLLFPLIVACSLRKIYTKALFNPEYIVPNLLTEWIMKDHKFAGIRYHTTKFRNFGRNKGVGLNYVFPPKKVEYTDEGYNDHLNKLFQWSIPNKLENLALINFPQSNNSIVSSTILSRGIKQLLINNYELTDFYKFDQLLDKYIKFDKINMSSIRNGKD